MNVFFDADQRGRLSFDFWFAFVAATDSIFDYSLNGQLNADSRLCILSQKQNDSLTVS